MRVLVIAQLFPWPVTGGGRMRLANVIRALQGLGEVDLFALSSRPSEMEPRDADVPLRRTMVVRRPEVRGGLWARARWFAGSPRPFELSVDYEAARRALDSWLDGPYDAVWFSRAETHTAFREKVANAPAIVDLDDLEGTKLRGSLLVAGRTVGGGAGLLRRLAARRNARRWDVLQREVAGTAERAVVCSEVDRLHLGGGGTIVVIPNGFDAPSRPRGHLEVADPPTILFQGDLRYAPNADAAAYLVREVGPHLRAAIPGVKIRLVGVNDWRVQGLHGPPHVTVTGFVPHIEEELARADVIVAPIRFGGGTRIKILEGFAHRIPVVTTTSGAQGLDVADGTHLAIADTPAGLAARTAAVLSDGGERSAMTDAAHALFIDRYQWSAARQHIQELVRAVAATAPASAGGGGGS